MPSDSEDRARLSLDLPPEPLWAGVMTASEIDLRDLWTRLRPETPFDEDAWLGDPTGCRWYLAHLAVARAHGEDAAEAMALLAERMTVVWQSHPDLLATTLTALTSGQQPIEDLLKAAAQAAGIAHLWPDPDPGRDDRPI